MAENLDVVVGEISKLSITLGKIDGRTEAIQSDISEVKKTQTDMYAKINRLRSDVDILQTEHDNHLKQCSVTVTANAMPQPLKLSQLLSMKEVTLIIIGAVFGVGLLGVGAVFFAGKMAKLW